MKESLSDFRSKILKLGPRKGYIDRCYGVKEAYRWLRKNRWLNIGKPIDECIYYEIIRRVHNGIIEALLNSDDIKLPCSMGRFMLVKNPNFVTIKNKKIITNRPVDWDATLKLWYEDEESKSKGIVVRQEEEYTYKVMFDKRHAKFKNMAFYIFRTNRSLKKKIKDAVKNGTLDSIIYKKRIKRNKK